MNLLSLSLHKAGAVDHVAYGVFSGLKNAEEFVWCRGGGNGVSLELVRVDSDTQTLQTVCSQPAFCVIRSLQAFQLMGKGKHFLCVGSDSGKMTVLEYVPERKEFAVVHCETFGRTGCRRAVPGQYMASDPQGRSVMVAAVEKQKLVYILNRDAQARLTISSPLEAHKSTTLVYHMVGVDVGFENPMFACLEVDYEEVDNDPTGEVAAKLPQVVLLFGSLKIVHF